MILIWGQTLSVLPAKGQSIKRSTVGYLSVRADCVTKLVFTRSPELFLFSNFSCQTFVDGQLRLRGKQEEGKGKCPFDPFQRYSSLMVGKCSELTNPLSLLLPSTQPAEALVFHSNWDILKCGLQSSPSCGWSQNRRIMLGKEFC